MQATATLTPHRVAPGDQLGLALYIALGLIAGCAYVAFDLISEGRISAGTLHGPWAGVHDVVDHVLPLLAGGLLGVAGHYVRMRARLATAEDAANRAEALRVRLQKVERDQAVWVVAAAVLHELNNPLHAIGLALDELAASHDDPTVRVDLISRARTQADRALSRLKMLKGMRSVGEPEVEVIFLDRIIQALASDLGSLVRDDGLSVRVECEGPIRAAADPEYLRTIVENLVDNGLQALREHGGSTITISVAVTGDRALVRVSDDGPESRTPLDDSVFEPLRSTKQRGLGLGLAISRGLARSMRGDLLLETTNRNGFRLELPTRAVA